MSKIKNKQNIIWLFYAAAFILSAYIFYCSPLLTDDYIYMSYNALNIKDALVSSLYYGNGRVLGNFLSLFFVQYPVLMLLERTSVLTLTIILLSKVASQNKETKSIVFLFVFVLIFGMSPKIFSEVFSWASGFHNYVPPILLTLVNISILKTEEKNNFRRFISIIAIFIFGVSSQLFVEHNTITNIAIAVLCVFVFRKESKKVFKAIIWLISLVLGAVTMFIVPKIFVVTSKVDVEGYRNIHLNSLSDLVTAVISNVQNVFYIFIGCFILFSVISILLIIIMKSNKDNWKNKRLFNICLTLNLLFLFYSLINMVLNNFVVFTRFFKVHLLIFAGVFMLFVFSFLLVIFNLRDKKTKNFILTCLFLSVLSIAPMMIVTPFGNRCLFLSCVIISLIAGVLFDYILKEGYINAEKTRRLSIIAAVSLSCLLCVIFADIKWLDIQQQNYVLAKMSEKPDVVEVLNFDSDYVYTDRTWGFAYYYYNEKPFDVDFVDLSFEKWYENRVNEGWY